MTKCGITDLFLALFILILIALPRLIQWACTRHKVLDALGPVVLCYAAGILGANLLVLLNPQLSETLTQSAQSLSEAAVPLSIPLLLFGQNLLKQLRSYRAMLGSFVLATLSVGLIAALMGLVFASHVPEVWKLAGMLVGVYTGGTPNMASIGLSLQVEKSAYLVMTAADTLLGGLYLLLLLTVMRPLLRPLFPTQNQAEDGEAYVQETARVKDMLLGFGLSVVIVLLSVGAAFLLTQSLSVPVVMLVLTSLGLGASLLKSVQNWRGTELLGEYFILIFCLSIGAMIRLDQVFQQSSGTILLFCTVVMFTTIALHLLLGRVFKQDLDTLLIASTAAIFGPPFVGAIAESLKRPGLIGAGLAVGVLGYAVGNYLGLVVAYGLLQLLG